MRKTLLFVLLCSILTFAFAANDVTLQDARTVAKNYITATNPTANISASDLVLRHTELNENHEALYYVFAINNGGFIIVSACESVTPILAYSQDSEYDASLSNYILNVYKSRINEARESANAPVDKTWAYYRNYVPTRNDVVETYVTTEVEPLLTSTWNQTIYYNNHCPAQADAVQSQINQDCDNHVPAGCVAADMSVIMHYYRYPEHGISGVSYRPIHYVIQNNEIVDTIVYPRQRQDFTVMHDYNLMPNSISEYTGEVAKLMWHAGISTFMDYGPSGSGAQSSEALTAMKDNWGYNRTAQQAIRTDYLTSASWIAELENELDSLRPIYYSGNDGHDGHAFMLDGYKVESTVTSRMQYSNPYQVLHHVDSTMHYDEDSVIYYTYDSVYTIAYGDSTLVYDTTTVHLFHVNWGWGGVNNAYYPITSGVDVYTQSQAAFIGCYPAGNPEKATEGRTNVYGTRGSISDGAGNKLYQPGTDRTWMIAAPEATKYTIKFLRLETEADADEVIFYKNGNLNDEAGRYSGNTVPAQFNINADSVLVRFVSNDNDVTGRGFVFDFKATTPAGYCDGETILTAAFGVITDKGEAVVDEGTPYRPESNCTWRINDFDKLYISYPQIELGAGDFIDIFDVTRTNKKYLLKRIDNYNWPAEDVLVIGGETHKVLIRFVSDNFEESNGWTLTYETVVGIEENNGLSNVSVYPNPASTTLNVDLTADFEGQLNFRIVDMTGRTISTESVANYGGDMHHTINVSNLSKGLYMLNIESKNGNSIRKFIVE